MKTQLKVAVTLALTALSYTAATSVLAFPSSAIEYSQLEAPLGSTILIAQIGTDRAFPVIGLEPTSPTAGSGVDD